MVAMDTAMETEIRANNFDGLPAKFINLCDRVIEILLITLLAFMPFTFGAVLNGSKEIVVIISASMLFVFFLKQGCLYLF